MGILFLCFKVSYFTYIGMYSLGVGFGSSLFLYYFELFLQGLSKVTLGFKDVCVNKWEPDGNPRTWLGFRIILRFQL